MGFLVQSPDRRTIDLGLRLSPAVGDEHRHRCRPWIRRPLAADSGEYVDRSGASVRSRRFCGHDLYRRAAVCLAAPASFGVSKITKDLLAMLGFGLIVAFAVHRAWL